jgi:hypothetical protein
MDRNRKGGENMNCPINERTADGVLVGRCWYHLPDGKTCPRHGDVGAAVETFEKTGKLTKEYPDTMVCNHPGLRKDTGGHWNPPCKGTATKRNPVFLGLEERGPWYGCTSCGCLAQYQDFIEHLKKPQEEASSQK